MRSFEWVTVIINLVKLGKYGHEELCVVASSRVRQAYQSFLAGLESRAVIVVKRRVVCFPVRSYACMPHEPVDTVGRKRDEVGTVDEKPLLFCGDRLWIVDEKHQHD